MTGSTSIGETRFKRHLIATQSASILVTILTAVVAIVALEAVTRNADRVSAVFADNLSLADRLRLDAERLVATSRAYLLNGEEEYRQRFHQLETTFADTLRRVSKSFDGQVPMAIEYDANAYIGAVKSAADQRALANDPRAIIAFFDHELQPKRETFERDVDAFVDRERTHFAHANARARRLAQRTQFVLAATSMIALALSIGLAALFLRALTRQVYRIERATEAAQQIAASRQELLAVVSHDLRNPLHSIVLAASAQRSLTANAGVDDKYLATVENAAHRMQHLIDDLLDNARIESGEIALHRERWNADALIREAVELFQPLATDRKVALRADALSSETVYADRERILRVFSNLIGNALRFVKAGDTLTVGSRVGDRSVRFEVTDTGAGIPADQLPRVFDRYYQGDRASEHGGLGVGLYICRRLVEAHHGTIGVASVVGQGTTFFFTLPVEPTRLD